MSCCKAVNAKPTGQPCRSSFNPGIAPLETVTCVLKTHPIKMFMNDCAPKYSTSFPGVATFGTAIIPNPISKPRMGMMKGLNVSLSTKSIMEFVWDGSKTALEPWW